MSKTRVVGVLALALPVSILAACGGSSSPSEPAPAPTATPVSPATPPPLPLSVIPPCPLSASSPGSSASCTKPPRKLDAEVNAAIDRVLALRPELFNFNNVNGGPQVLKIDPYMVAVAAALGEAGVCGHIDPEGEIGVKTDNRFNEQWIIVSRAGWGVPTDNWVQRKYIGACSPSVF